MPPNALTSLVLMPDEWEHPFGGMGVQMRGLVSGAREAGLPVHFSVVGTAGRPVQDAQLVYVPAHMHHILMPAVPLPAYLAGGYTQADFIDAGLWLAGQKKPDLVHAFDYSAVYAGIRLADRLQVPLVVTFQLSQTMLAFFSGVLPAKEDQAYLNLALALEMAALREAKAVIQVSQAYQQFWSVLAPEAAERMVVIPNGVEQGPAQQPRPVFYGDETNVLYMGRACIQKGTHLLLDVLEQDLWPEGARLFWAGSERGGAPQLWERLQALGDRVTLLGHLEGDAKWAALQHADAVLMPSTHEPFGIVALEAMEAGTPLLTTGVDGLGEFCNTDNSLLIPVSAEGIAAGVRYAMGMPAEERQALVASGRRTAAGYRWPQIAQQVFEVYQKAVS
jgi:1,4-alpha-glucan branching enzyme